MGRQLRDAEKERDSHSARLAKALPELEEKTKIIDEVEAQINTLEESLMQTAEVSHRRREPDADGESLSSSRTRYAACTVLGSHHCSPVDSTHKALMNLVMNPMKLGLR